MQSHVGGPSKQARKLGDAVRGPGSLGRFAPGDEYFAAKLCRDITANCANAELVKGGRARGRDRRDEAVIISVKRSMHYPSIERVVFSMAQFFRLLQR